MNDKTCSGFAKSGSERYHLPAGYCLVPHVDPRSILSIGGRALIEVNGTYGYHVGAGRDAQQRGEPVLCWRYNNGFRVWPTPNRDCEVIITPCEKPPVVAVRESPSVTEKEISQDPVLALVDLPADLANTWSQAMREALPPRTPEQRMALLRGVGMIRDAAHRALMAYLDAPPGSLFADVVQDPVDLGALRAAGLWPDGRPNTGENGQ